MSTENPIVSIICLTFNHEKFIKNSLDGFVMQETNFPFEIIIHDDASTDNTTNIIREYESKYKDLFKPIYQSENQASQERGRVTRIAFNEAKGKYIALCEGDDYWTDPLKLQKQVDFLEGNLDYGLVYTDLVRYFENKGIIEEGVFKNILGYKENTFEDFLINGWWLAPCTWMIRRDTLVQLPRYPSNFRVGDFPMLLSLARFSKIGFISDSTAVYRVLEKSASRNNSNWRFDYSLRKGVFEIQLYFGERHDVSAFLMDKIYSNYYREKINDSILLDDKPMYNVASNYLRSRGMLNWKNRLLLFAAEWPLVLRTVAKIWRKE
jgi:glycosyltransferase involved in cell wall biosynthesis